MSLLITLFTRQTWNNGTRVRGILHVLRQLFLFLFLSKYQQAKVQLINALNAVKYLKRQLRASEERASALYLRYAIESDLNRRLNQLTQQKLKEEKERLQKDQG